MISIELSPAGLQLARRWAPIAGILAAELGGLILAISACYR